MKWIIASAGFASVIYCLRTKFITLNFIYLDRSQFSGKKTDVTLQQKIRVRAYVLRNHSESAVHPYFQQDFDYLIRVYSNFRTALFCGYLYVGQCNDC